MKIAILLICFLGSFPNLVQANPSTHQFVSFEQFSTTYPLTVTEALIIGQQNFDATRVDGNLNKTHYEFFESTLWKDFPLLSLYKSLERAEVENLINMIGYFKVQGIDFEKQASRILTTFGNAHSGLLAIEATEREIDIEISLLRNKESQAEPDQQQQIQERLIEKERHFLDLVFSKHNLAHYLLHLRKAFQENFQTRAADLQPSY